METPLVRTCPHCGACVDSDYAAAVGACGCPPFVPRDARAARRQTLRIVAAAILVGTAPTRAIAQRWQRRLNALLAHAGQLEPVPMHAWHPNPNPHLPPDVPYDPDAQGETVYGSFG